MSRRRRLEFVHRHMTPAELQGSRILEVGALDSPMFPHRSKFLDWFSSDELRGALAGSRTRRAGALIEPDYVVKTKRFATKVLPDRFDVLVASHVIEHVADPITWMQQLAAVGTEEATLFLSVPDRRFTFDFLRPVSTVADLVRAHAEDLDRPSRWQMLDSVFYHRPFRAGHAWSGDKSPLRREGRYTLEEAIKVSERADREYVDVHCHVFTAKSFRSLLNHLAPMTGWDVIQVTKVAKDSNEFQACLRRRRGR